MKICVVVVLDLNAVVEVSIICWSDYDDASGKCWERKVLKNINKMRWDVKEICCGD